MAVRVQVPLTVRLPEGRRLVAADLAQLEVGTGDALARAFDTIREDVLVPRGRERVVTVGDASLHFAAGVDEAMRPGLHQAIQRAVDHAVARSELRSWYRPTGPVAALTGAPVAWLDPARRSGGAYSIQLFDDGTPGTITMEAEIIERPFTAGDAAALAWKAHLRRFGRVWEPATYGYPGYYGNFAYEGQAQTSSLVYLYEVESLDEKGWPVNARWQIGAFWMLRYAEDEDSIVRGALRPAMGHWLMTRTDQGVSYDDILRRYNERDEARPESERLPPEVQERMARVAADYAQASPGAAVWSLDDGATPSEVLLEPATEGSWGIAHSPLRFVAEQQLFGTGDEAEGGGGEHEGAGGEGDEAGGGGGDGGTGEGGRSGDGRGRGGRRRRGGPLGTAEGEGSAWPTLAVGGERLVCQPFLGEPPVTQLVVGSQALETEMRDLAATLEVDYCGYAGQLCINLAKLIGARAHAIGVTSVTSTVTTAVTSRPDGGGNHGFVDIRPTSSAELSYMDSLADLAVRVNNLANSISRTYLAGPNQHLIHWDEDRELDPNPAAWSLRFWGEMSDMLPQTCMWLFAETCRVILLQQLRSSHAGIVARQDQFDETHRRFDEALGILGESVVKLSVLKQAIAHARRMEVTGPVRQVLATLPPPRRMGREGDEYQPPAPIESLSPRILEVLEGATIERQGDDDVVAIYDGRSWTTEELEQGVGLRRSILNLADPLFFQVPDLDRLYHQFRIDPSRSKDYLRTLLGQMRKANEEMTREASDREEGAFFSLEASQWVAAQGGVNSLGLHYDLQGLHKQADDRLRPWMSSLGAYNDGVDRALGIKANWDRFLQVFAIAGVIVLALLCAPLGAVAVGVVTGVAGIALTVHDVMEADRLEELYRSLEDPEAVLSWQDVQLARLMADLSIAFSIFDVFLVGKGVGRAAEAIVSGASRGLREVSERGLRSSVRGAVQTTLTKERREVLAKMAAEVMGNAVRAATAQAAIAGTMQAVLPVVITPVLVPWIRGVALEHGSLTRVDAVLGDLTAGQPATPIAVPAPLPSAIELPEGVEP